MMVLCVYPEIAGNSTIYTDVFESNDSPIIARGVQF
jgi:hypothetical protein